MHRKCKAAPPTVKSQMVTLLKDGVMRKKMAF